MAAPALEQELARLQALSGGALGSLCRTCLAARPRAHMLSLYDSADVETAAEMLSAIASVQLSYGDGLPDRLCKDCIELVGKCFAFKQLCERSESILRCFITQGHLQGMKLEPGSVNVFGNMEKISGDDMKHEVKSDLINYDLYLEDDFHDSASPRSVIRMDDVVGKENSDIFDLNSNTPSQAKNLSITTNPTISINPESDVKNKLVKKKNIKRARTVFTGNGMNKISKPKLKNQNKQELTELSVSTLQKRTEDNKKANIFSCGECGKQFPNHHRLTRHKRIHQDDKLYNCSVCKKGFNDFRDFNRHLRKHNPTKEDEENKSNEPSFACPQCHLTFTSEGDLQIHSSVHVTTGDKCICQHCKKEFDTTLQLKRHVRTHLNDKPHKCSVCTKGFAEMGSLTRHFRRHTGETRERKHVCTECNKGYYDSHALKIHQRTHTGEKPWECVDCGRRFTDSRLLNSHRKTHSDLKPHACDMCDKMFRHESTLITHKRTHTGEKPYICSVCGNAFVQSSNLLLHMRTHTHEKPYGCKFCVKRFSSSSALTIHTRTHTGEKPYVCNICFKRFARCDLKAHMRTHNVEKQHECPICHHNFASQSLMQRHIQSHTGSEKLVDYQEALKQTPVRERSFVCIICGKACSTSFFLKKHLTKAHNMITLSLDTVCTKASIALADDKLYTDGEVKAEIVIQANDVINIPSSLALSENNLNVVTVSNSGIARIASDLGISTLNEQHEIVSTEVGTIVSNALITDDKIYQIDPELLRIHNVSTENLTHSTQLSITEISDADH